VAAYTKFRIDSKFLVEEFSEVPHRPDPMRQGFLCRVSEVPSPMYIRNGEYYWTYHGPST
jgi:hypothetical protein